MTREEIMALDGRELDAAVSEHVMGYKVALVTHWVFGQWKIVDGTGATKLMPSYSTDRNAAAKAVEEIERRGLEDDVEWALKTRLGIKLFMQALTASPKSICQAALLAVMEVPRG